MNEGLLTDPLGAVLARGLQGRRGPAEGGLLFAALERGLELGGLQPLLVEVEGVAPSDATGLDERLGLPADLDLGGRLLYLVVDYRPPHVGRRALR